MMKYTIKAAPGYILSIFAAICFILAGCSDDSLNLQNDLGSTLKEQGNVKVSSFIVDKKYWNIPDKVTDLVITLTSHTDSSVREYPATITVSEGKFTCLLQIPGNERIPDSDYDLKATLPDGRPLGNLLKVTFRDEMLHLVIGSVMQYTLYGKGTAENPYEIGSKEDFDQFEYDLSRDSVNHGAGLYFKQTADFEAPPRSDVYQGRYYAGYIFAGTYDGGNHTISLPYIGSMEDDDVSIGLFRALCNGALIKNLTVRPRMTGIKTNGGALAGTSRDHVKISGVTVDGSITACGSSIGGFIGSAEGNLILENCNFVNGSITDCGSSIGGFIGSATGQLIIKNCRLYAQVNGNDNIGGVTGSFSKGELQVDGLSNIREDYTPALFTVYSVKSNAGGVAGSITDAYCRLTDITLQHAISEQDVNLKVIYSGENNCGGLIGEAKLSGGCSIKGVKILAPVRAEKDNAGGLIGYSDLSSELSVQNSSVASLVKGNNNIGGFFGWMNSNNHLVLEGRDKANRIAQVDNGYLAVEGQSCIGGMFGYLENDIKAKSVSLINVKVTAHAHFGGGVVGKNYKNTLECKYFALDPDMQVQGPDAIGGIVGYAASSTVTGRIEGDLQLVPLPSPGSFKSDFAGTVSSGDGNSENGTTMGGIVGYAEDSNLNNLTFTGKVFGATHVGGIVGHATNNSRGELKNCVANAAVVKSSKGRDTGGVAGRLVTHTGTYRNLLNFGKIEGADYTGGVIGFIYPYQDKPELLVEYAVNLGDVSGGNDAGGCVGALFDGFDDNFHTLRYCANYGKVTNSGSGTAGGIIGLGDAARLSVMNCANHGEVAGGPGESKVGGIAGRLGMNPVGVTKGENMEMAYCCNRGMVSSDNAKSHVGGLLGYQEDGNDYDATHWMTHDCYNTGAVTSDQKSNNGGIVGCVDHYAEVVRCINIGKVYHGNGVVGTHKDGSIWHHHNLYYLEGTGSGWCASSFSDDKKKETKTFSGFDFDSVWAIDENDEMNNGFPYLRDCPFQFVRK